MIVTTQKPLDELLGFISPYGSDILVAGCDGCTQPTRGVKEAETLAQLLELGGRSGGKNFTFKTMTVAKQCDDYLVNDVVKPELDGVAAVLSLACGIGVGTLAQLFPEVPVFPAQNTHFMGAESREESILQEMCGGCGECRLGLTGGVCPVVRCSKGLLNGQCGGSKNGKCELSPDKDCGWVLIYEALKRQGKLENLKEFLPARDFQLTNWRIAT